MDTRQNANDDASVETWQSKTAAIRRYALFDAAARGKEGTVRRIARAMSQGELEGTVMDLSRTTLYVVQEFRTGGE